MKQGERPTVAVTRCSRYHEEDLRRALIELLEPFGGIAGVVKPGQKVLLKPNLLAAARPAEAVTTHPLVVRLVAEMALQVGAEVFIGDSPGSDSQVEAHRAAGMQEVAEQTGARLLFFGRQKAVIMKDSAFGKIPLVAELEQVDLVINLPKLKTHALTGLTGAVKNVYGCLGGNSKKRFHLEHPLPLDFSRLLLDVYLAVKPAFSIMDAVVGMEGAGPRRGRQRRLGLLLASRNAVALDCVAADITGFQQDQVTTLVAARERKIAGSRLEEIEISGASLDSCRVSEFDRGPASSGRVSRLVTALPFSFLRNFIYARRPYPEIDCSVCTSCGSCAGNCPVQVISLSSGLPVIDLYECIRCYCCLEACAEGAVLLPPGTRP